LARRFTTQSHRTRNPLLPHRAWLWIVDAPRRAGGNGEDSECSDSATEAVPSTRAILDCLALPRQSRRATDGTPTIPPGANPLLPQLCAHPDRRHAPRGRVWCERGTRGLRALSIWSPTGGQRAGIAGLCAAALLDQTQAHGVSRSFIDPARATSSPSSPARAPPRDGGGWGGLQATNVALPKRLLPPGLVDAPGELALGILGTIAARTLLSVTDR
jgi:hypothetical protein